MRALRKVAPQRSNGMLDGGRRHGVAAVLLAGDAGRGGVDPGCGGCARSAPPGRRRTLPAGPPAPRSPPAGRAGNQLRPVRPAVQRRRRSTTMATAACSGRLCEGCRDGAPPRSRPWRTRHRATDREDRGGSRQPLQGNRRGPCGGQALGGRQAVGGTHGRHRAGQHDERCAPRSTAPAGPAVHRRSRSGRRPRPRATKARPAARPPGSDHAPARSGAPAHELCGRGSAVILAPCESWR